MRILRMSLALLTALAALWELYPLCMTVGYKLHLLSATGADAKYVPLMQATQWWQVAIWIAVTVLFAVTAWRLLRGAKALAFYAAAFLLQLIGWWLFHNMPVYNQTFSAAELQADYWMLGAMLVVGVLIWLVESRSASAQTAAA